MKPYLKLQEIKEDSDSVKSVSQIDSLKQKIIDLDFEDPFKIQAETRLSELVKIY